MNKNVEKMEHGEKNMKKNEEMVNSWRMQLVYFRKYATPLEAWPRTVVKTKHKHSTFLLLSDRCDIIFAV